MASSVVEICSRALDAIGVQPITDFAEDTKQGGLCRRYYPQVRDEVIRSHPWNCASTRASLPALVDAPTWGYANAYQLPSDCLRVLAVNADDPFCHPWKVEGRTIVTDREAPIQILYLRRIDDSGFFDPMLVSAIAARLAMELARPLTSDENLRKNMGAEYRDRLREARSADGQEGTPSRIYAEEFVIARL
jgi:hypothetical protein